MEYLWLTLGIASFSAVQFRLSKLADSRIRAVMPWAFAVAMAFVVAAFLPNEERRRLYGWPALNAQHLLRTGGLWCIPAFEATLVARWFLHKPRTFTDFMLRCSATTFVVWVITVVVLSIVTPDS